MFGLKENEVGTSSFEGKLVFWFVLFFKFRSFVSHCVSSNFWLMEFFCFRFLCKCFVMFYELLRGRRKSSGARALCFFMFFYVKSVCIFLLKKARYLLFYIEKPWKTTASASCLRIKYVLQWILSLDPTYLFITSLYHHQFSVFFSFRFCSTRCIEMALKNFGRFLIIAYLLCETLISYWFISRLRIYGRMNVDTSRDWLFVVYIYTRSCFFYFLLNL